MSDLSDLFSLALMTLFLFGTALVAATRATLRQIRYNPLATLLAETTALSEAYQQVLRRWGDFAVAVTATRVLFSSAVVVLAFRVGGVGGLVGAVGLLLFAELAGEVVATRPQGITWGMGVARFLRYGTFPLSMTAGRWVGRLLSDRTNRSKTPPTRSAIVSSNGRNAR